MLGASDGGCGLCASACMVMRRQAAAKDRTASFIGESRSDRKDACQDVTSNGAIAFRREAERQTSS